MNYRKWIALLLAATALAACAVREAPTETPRPQPRPPPVLRLLTVEPAVGSAVDTATVITATLAYDIPDRPKGHAYRVIPTFVSERSGTFNRPPDVSVELTQARGVVTVRYPMRELMRDPQLATPVTGYFYLLETSPVEPDLPVRDSVIEGRQVQVRMRRAGTARARTRAFYYNGQGARHPNRQSLTSLPSSLEEYVTYGGRKAFALAVDTAGRWQSGYSYGYATRDQAIARALEFCRSGVARRSLDADCELVLVDDQPVGEGNVLPPDRLGYAAPIETISRTVPAVPDAFSPPTLVDSTSYDLDGDGVRERVELLSDVTRDAEGRLLFEDAHRWQLLVRDGDVVFPLADAIVPFGRLDFHLVQSPGAFPVVVAEQTGAQGVSVDAFVWDPDLRRYAVRSVSVRGPVLHRSRF